MRGWLGMGVIFLVKFFLLLINVGVELSGRYGLGVMWFMWLLLVWRLLSDLVLVFVVRMMGLWRMVVCLELLGRCLSVVCMGSVMSIWLLLCYLCVSLM